MTTELPVSIIVPVLAERFDLYRLSVEPSLRAMNPGEIIPVFQDGTAPQRRNLGASRAKEPFLLFSDDDVIWHKDALAAMLGFLLRHPANTGYVYTNFMMVNHPTRGTQAHEAGEWSATKLRSHNFISTMSLMRREALEATNGWDERLERLQDWDLWLQMLKKGIIGAHLPVVAFTAIYDPNGITKADGYARAHQIIQEKHGL